MIKIRIHRFINEIDNFSIGSYHYSKTSGWFTIIAYEKDLYNKNNIYKVKFIDTGYETYSSKPHIRNGEIDDPLRPRTCGIGFKGESYKLIKDTYDEKILKSLYYKWAAMMARCYNEKNPRYKSYGKLGVTVDERWHNFSNFFYDAMKLPGWDLEKVLSGELSIDKDYRQQNSQFKVYSKDTCCWLTVIEQNSLIDTVKSHEKYMKKFIVSHDGINEIALGYKAFEREHGLPHGSINKSIDKNIKVHGYLFYSTDNQFNDYPEICQIQQQEYGSSEWVRSP